MMSHVNLSGEITVFSEDARPLFSITLRCGEWSVWVSPEVAKDEQPSISRGTAQELARFMAFHTRQG